MSQQDNQNQRPAQGFKTMCGGQALIEGIMMRGWEAIPREAARERVLSFPIGCVCFCHPAF